MNRRQLLRATGWSAAGLTLVASGGCGLLPALPTFGESSEADAFTWIQLTPGGDIVFLLPRAELGQGIDTGLTMLVAEELQTPPAEITCQYQRTDAMAPCQMTVGSQSIENYGALTSLAAAALREELLRRAAQQMGAKREELVCRDGAIHRGEQQLCFAALLVAGEETLMGAAPTAPPELYSDRPSPRFIGQNGPSQQLRRLVTGEEVYSRDVTLPEMVFGQVAHPPQLTATLTGFDIEAAKRTDGVLEVVRGPLDEIGVVAQTPIAAAAGVEALACTWSALTTEELRAIDDQLDIDTAIEQKQLDHTPIDEGRIRTGREAAENALDLRYDTPMAAHAAMEPRAGVAKPSSNGLEVWTGSQDPWYVRAAVSKALGLSAERVTVHNCRVGGGFGGRIHCQASLEAAWLADATGRSVKVQWSREDEFRYNYVGPQFSTRIQAGLTAEGELSYWHHRMVGAPVLTSSLLIPRSLHWLANLPADPGTIRGTQLPYAVENHLVETADVRTPMPTGAWRGLGAAPNTFAVECAMDELALAARRDPVEFRIAHATDERLAGVLRRLAELTAGEANLGVAATAYKGVTFVAIAAQFTQSPRGRKLQRLWCVHDCGRMVSPDRVLAQVEGNLIWGVSMALIEDFRVSGGIAETDNFDRYPVARHGDVPPLTIELVASDAPSSGAAEAALAPAAAAIANALSRSTGQRERRLPLRRLS